MKSVRLTILALLASLGVSSAAQAKICVDNQGVYVARFYLQTEQQVDLQASGLGQYVNTNPSPYVSLGNGDYLMKVDGNTGLVWRTQGYNGGSDCMDAPDMSSRYRTVSAPSYGVEAEFIPFPGIWKDIDGASSSSPARIQDGQTLTTHGTTFNPSITVQ